jgi:NAD(P)H dehydrogenase (quinone)
VAERVEDRSEHPWLRAMFAYYDRHGLPVGTLPLRALLG